jgi:flagellar hook protein FlgE
MAIEGAGYFVVQNPSGRRYFTRDGSFSLNSAHELVNMDGMRLQGYPVDANFQIVPGTLSDLTIPLGQLNITSATQNVAMDGDLSAAASIATQGSRHATQAFVAGGGAAATAATALADLRSASSAGTVLFAAGDTITVSGITRGERTLPTQQFIVGQTGSTLGDFAAWMQNALGIQSDASLVGSPGVVIENGALVVRGNAGEPNNLLIQSGDLRSSNSANPLPFQFTQTQAATGSGVFTSLSVYDSLGNSVPVNVTFTLEGTPDTGPVWRYFIESADPNVTRTLETGLLTFDNDGRFVSASNTEITLNRAGTGAATPLTFTMDFSGINGQSTQVSNVIMAAQDGYPPGTLNSYGIGADGTITGVFSNGLARPLGQVVLATFTNEEGLVAETDNLYSVAPNSGAAMISVPGTLGAGGVRGGALEMSNVDISNEFIGLITSSAGFQASSRVISVSNEMLDQLLMTLR